ncbi:MAG: ATP-binding protein [Phormidesmis sp.]
MRTSNTHSSSNSVQAAEQDDRSSMLSMGINVGYETSVCEISQQQQQYTILIVDDAEADRLTYRRYIDKSGIYCCTVVESDCGEEALARCQQSVPDLILLDYMLPDLNGLEFLSTLQQTMYPLPPVIMLTGQGDEKVAVEAMKVGVRDYLVKGELSAEQLSQAIRRVLSQQALQQLVNRQQRQQQLMASIALRISQISCLDKILQTAADGIRQLLDCDRAVIYRFESDMSGTILAESVLPEWTVSLGTQIEDTCFQENGAERYLQGHKTVIADIYDSSLTPCHIKMLERFQVRANLVVPIVLSETETTGKRLWGLLLAHHCREVRTWQPDELALLDALSVQLAIALQQAELVSTLQDRAQALTMANERLLETTQLVKERNQELDEFAYVASHDLKAPLRAIANLAGWLEEDLKDKIPAESQEQLGLIGSRVKRLDNFITGLLEYSRVGRVGLERSRVDTGALVDEVIDSLVTPADFEILRPETMPVISTYRLLLQQVLANLMSNAIKYHHRPDGRVTITADDLGPEIAFAVTDDGPGIKAEDQQKIFGIFQTLSSRDDIDSAGIGLSIVKKAVERQGGTVMVRSRLGKGSTFTFTWPKDS